MSNDYYDVDNDVMMLTMPRMIIEISSASWSSALYRGSCFTKRLTNVCSPFHSDVCTDIDDKS